MTLQDSAQAQSTFSERFRATFGDVFGEFVPQLLAALAIVFIGYLVAKLAERLVDRVLRKIGLNRILDRGGVLEAVERSGARVNPTRLLSNLVFWLLMFAVILAAANILGLESVASVFTTLVAYIPRVIAAVVIILVGIVLGQFVGGLIAASTGTMAGGRAMSRLGTAGVIVLAVFMALQELGIATEIVTTAFAILFGAVALAISIAFGLGNRDLAGEVTRAWYDEYQRERRESAAQATAEEEDDDTDERSTTPPAAGG